VTSRASDAASGTPESGVSAKLSPNSSGATTIGITVCVTNTTGAT